MITVTGDVCPFSCRVRVYWNRQRKLWSIATDERVGDVPANRVIAYSVDDVTLSGATFVVDVTRHRTALAGTGKRGTKRNVVAWVTGKLCDGANVVTDPQRVTFHWEDGRSVFYVVATGAPVATADVATFKTVTGDDGKPAGKVFV